MSYTWPLYAILPKHFDKESKDEDKETVEHTPIIHPTCQPHDDLLPHYALEEVRWRPYVRGLLRLLGFSAG